MPSTPRHFVRAQYLLAVAALAAATSLTACGSTPNRQALLDTLTPGPCGRLTCSTPAPSPSTSAPTQVDATEAGPTDSPSSSGGSPTTLGTATLVGNGDTTTSSFAVGPAQLQKDANVPGTVLAACRWPAPDRLVWIHGTITVTYQGSISQTVGISPSVNLITDSSRQGQVVIAAPGNQGWYGCDSSIGGGTTKLWNFTFSGKSGPHTYDMWIGIPLISNATPTLTTDMTNALQIQFTAFAADQFYGFTPTWSGPHTASCDDGSASRGGRLLLYATAPTTYRGPDSPITCMPTSG